METEKVIDRIVFDKTLSGYHMLMIIAGVDGDVNAVEEKVIRKYIKMNYSFLSNLEDETKLLSNLPRELYQQHFYKSAVDFYSQSTTKERMELLDFVMKVILADKTVSKEENKYLNDLYNIWDLA